MAWFQNKPTKRRRGERGPAKSGEDRLKREQARAIALALKQHPEMAEKIAVQALGLSASDPFADTLERIARFREVFPDIRDVDRPPGVDWAHVIAGGLAVFAQLQQGRGVPALGAAGGSYQAPTVPPAAAPPAPVVAVAAEEARSVETDIGPIALPDATIDGPCAVQSRVVIALLAHKSPAEAAATLLEMAPSVPNGQAALTELCAVADGELAAYLAALGARHAHLEGLARWLGGHIRWTQAVVSELRRRAASAAA
jgi:hypothetical protein